MTKLEWLLEKLVAKQKKTEITLEQLVQKHFPGIRYTVKYKSKTRRKMKRKS